MCLSEPFPQNRSVPVTNFVVENPIIVEHTFRKIALSGPVLDFNEFDKITKLMIVPIDDEVPDVPPYA